MDKTIVRDVRDITLRDRDALEHALGEPLRDDQRLIVRIQTISGVEPQGIPPIEDLTLPEWCDVFRGLSDMEIADVEAVARQRLDLTRPSA